jgi:hypothetical protein
MPGLNPLEMRPIERAAKGHSSVTDLHQGDRGAAGLQLLGGLGVLRCWGKEWGKRRRLGLTQRQRWGRGRWPTELFAVTACAGGRGKGKRGHWG